jgi:hypothetical protein
MIRKKSFRLRDREACKHLLGLILAFSLSGHMVLAQDLVIVSSRVGECSLAVESNEKWHTLRLRAHHPRYEGCQIDEASMVSILNAAFSKTESPKLEENYSSLSIGRLIDYPWMCQHLATTAYRDRGWDLKKGKPVGMDINKYVSQLLFRKEFMVQLRTAFEKGGYRIVGATVEKVFVGGFREVPFYHGEKHAGKVPYDAQVWFRLERNWN